MKPSLYISLVIGLLFGICSSASARMMTDTKGNKIDLKLISWNHDVVKVETKSKQEKVLPLTRFRDADQEYVRKNVQRDFNLGADIANRDYKLEDGRAFSAKLIGLRGMDVIMRSASGKEVTLSLFQFSAGDREFVVDHAPHLDSLNANPELRHDPAVITKAVQRINSLMTDYYTAERLQPNPAVEDATFLRRAYLSIIGRTPDAMEARDFIRDTDKDKRITLIDELYEHPGYVHHAFNYWADLLRIKSRLQGRNYGTQVYAQWVKDSIRENKPYDEMVYEMITATGYYWDNPAVGFYRRDLNMPLDHLAVMCQTLLGTSIVCAQCHDHPFDTWTQKEYYEMAAFTYPMVTRLRPGSEKVIQETLAIAKKEIPDRKELNAFNAETRRTKQYLIDYPLVSGNEIGTRRLSYPKTYAYGNAKPGSHVVPVTPFGEELEITNTKEETITPFAKWFISPENPRFARNIANRLWKEAFGNGLIEPVDDIRFDSESFHPEMLNYLTQLLVDLDFDLKTYSRILRHTRFFAQQAYAAEVNPVEGYPMTGPLLRRMTAEQMWDSIIALMVPNIDERINYSLLRTDADIAARAMATLKADPKELFEQIKAGRGVENKQAQKIAGKGVKAYDSTGSMVLGEGMTLTGLAPQAKIPQPPKTLHKRDRAAWTHEQRLKQDPWYLYRRDYYRAAELPSPAPGGHFLNMFGQSDRDLTENDNQEASIPQVLTLMNDDKLLTEILTSKHSELRKLLDDAPDARSRLDIMFLGTYNRYPTDREANEIVSRTKGDPFADNQHILWAVLNSQPYRFIQ